MKDWRCLPWMTVVMVFLANSAVADLVDNGLFSTIDQPGNPSHGLSFLDMSFSDGKTLADALADAQVVLPDARAATPSEFDDLFASVDTVYLGSYRPSDAFDTGLYYNISVDEAAITTIIDLLGATAAVSGGSRALKVFTDPDGVYSSQTTRDMLGLYSRPQHADYFVCISQDDSTPPERAYGWFLVSESGHVVPVPGAFILGVLGLSTTSVMLRRKCK